MTVLKHAGNLAMRTLSTEDIEYLFEMYYNPETQYLWLPDGEAVGFESFKNQLMRRIAHRWNHFVVFEQAESRQIIGFSYCYQVSFSNRTAYLCQYIDKPHMNSPDSLKASYIYLSYLFEDCSYRRLFAEVFAYNTQCVQLLSKLRFEQEGCLKAYQWWQDRYWDQYIFSITPNTFDHLRITYHKILNRPSWNTKIN